MYVSNEGTGVFCDIRRFVPNQHTDDMPFLYGRGRTIAECARTQTRATICPINLRYGHWISSPTGLLTKGTDLISYDTAQQKFSTNFIIASRFECI